MGQRKVEGKMDRKAYRPKPEGAVLFVDNGFHNAGPRLRLFRWHDSCRVEALHNQPHCHHHFLNLAVCAKFRPLASHGTPWRHSKIPHRCDTRRHGRSDDHKRGRRRVF